VAVLQIQPKAAGSEQVGDTLREMIITALINSGMFNVVERGALDAIINEQDLGNSGRSTAESSAKTGKLLGAQVLISGAITEFTNVSSGGGMLLGPLVVGGKSAKLAIDLRIIDANTGEIIASEKAEGRLPHRWWEAEAVSMGLRWEEFWLKMNRLAKPPEMQWAKRSTSLLVIPPLSNGVGGSLKEITIPFMSIRGATPELN
jgi:hypothetical protein